MFEIWQGSKPSSASLRTTENLSRRAIREKTLRMEIDRTPPDGHLRMADFWTQLRQEIEARPNFPRVVWPEAMSAQLQKLQEDDVELEQIANSLGLRMFAPGRRVALQEVAPEFSRVTLYPFYDLSGDYVADIVASARAFGIIERRGRHSVMPQPLTRQTKK
jgi:hypothetical protein